MSFFFEGNGYFDGSIVIRSSIGNSLISQSALTQSSIDMLSVLGFYQPITNVQDPVNPQDAATKKYVDDLGIVRSNVTLTGTTSIIISNVSKGSFVITVSNLVLNGPSGIFHVTKNEANNSAHIVRTVAAPGLSTTPVFLELLWPINGSIQLRKTGSAYDGSYAIKIM